MTQPDEVLAWLTVLKITVISIAPRSGSIFSRMANVCRENLTPMTIRPVRAVSIKAVLRM